MQGYEKVMVGNSSCEIKPNGKSEKKNNNNHT